VGQTRFPFSYPFPDAIIPPITFKDKILDDRQATNSPSGNPINEDYKLNSLIDLNARPEDGKNVEFQPLPDSETSTLKPREATPAEIQSLGLIYGLIGFGLSLVMLLFAIIAIVNLGDELPDHVTSLIITMCIILTVVNVGVAVRVAISKLSTETESGRLLINKDSITYWTVNGDVTVPMSQVFGAGPDIGSIFPSLRIYYLSDATRGFAYVKRNFKRYQLTEGPAMRSIVVTDDGNEIVRKTIIYHRRKRKKAGLEYAKVPSFKFRSGQKSLQAAIFGDNPPVEFNCDGVTLFYTSKDENYKIPVEMIESAKVVKVQTQYGITKWDIVLKTNLASGFENVTVNALRLQHSEEVELYCRAIATSFPEKDDGYWD
jgi:hypothetical protein